MRVRALLVASLCTAIQSVVPSAASAQEAIPNFSGSIDSAWRGTDAPRLYLIPSPDGPQPVSISRELFDKVYQATSAFPVVNLDNPNLQPQEVDALRANNDAVLAGKPLQFALSSCWPAGVVVLHMLGTLYPLYFAQAEKEVVIISQLNTQARHVLLNQQHSVNPRPSWNGESVGHYENGDTLVVDTIGMNDRTVLDALRTPHTSALHLIERFKLTEDGKAMEVKVRVEDSGAFKVPYEVTRHYSRVEIPLREEICAENPNPFLDQGFQPIPKADKPDF